MFSFYSDGVKHTKSDEAIDMLTLIDYLKDNPLKDYIQEIRNTRLKGDKSYKEMKLSLPNISPNCITSHRCLRQEVFSKNFHRMSKYLYFDIDDVEDIENYKKHLIDTYGEQAVLICTSVSGKGISMFFRIDSDLRENNFRSVWNYIRNTILENENVDEKVSNLGRIWFLTQDENLFFNPDASIKIPSKVLRNIHPPYDIEKDSTKPSKSEKRKIKEQTKQSKSRLMKIYNELEEPYTSDITSIPPSSTLEGIIWQTPVSTDKPIVEVKSHESFKLYIPKSIKDGKKRSTFVRIMNTLLELNPHYTKEQTLSFLSGINTRNTTVPMVESELVRLVNFEYDNILKRGTAYAKSKTKNLVFNKDCDLSRLDKMKVANKINGSIRKNNTIKIIEEAIELLISYDVKVNRVNICNVSGLSYSSVCRNYYEPTSNVNSIVESINNTLSVY